MARIEDAFGKHDESSRSYPSAGAHFDSDTILPNPPILLVALPPTRMGGFFPPPNIPPIQWTPHARCLTRLHVESDFFR